jgi:2',3'-cyclic-nucleotide 2'-phosphodiesterase (5'-nucleotidase family)
VGGAARFVHIVKKLREENKNTLVLFSGDIFSPSVSIFYFLYSEYYIQGRAYVANYR